MAASRATDRAAPPTAGEETRDRSAVGERQRRWAAETLGPALAKTPERRDEFTTLGGIPVDRLYTPHSPRSGFDAIGYPGEFPFTRGIHPTMYRGRVWSMRMFSGFGTPEDTNRRFHYLLAHGESGLS